MQKSKIETLVATWVEEVFTDTDLELVDVEYIKEGKDWFLRIFIDKLGGVDIEDCRNISKIISERLDQTDPISTTYCLEVSSPGLERPLKKESDFVRSIGQMIRIKTFKAIEEKKEFVGKLLAVEAGVVHIEVKNQPMKIPTEQIAKAHLEVEF